jgi:hypothetical protein
MIGKALKSTLVRQADSCAAKPIKSSAAVVLAESVNLLLALTEDRQQYSR